jgi:hypothetical protein
MSISSHMERTWGFKRGYTCVRECVCLCMRERVCLCAHMCVCMLEGKRACPVARNADSNCAPHTAQSWHSSGHGRRHALAIPAHPGPSTRRPIHTPADSLTPHRRARNTPGAPPRAHPFVGVLRGHQAKPGAAPALPHRAAVGAQPSIVRPAARHAAHALVAAADGGELLEWVADRRVGPHVGAGRGVTGLVQGAALGRRVERGRGGST